MKVVTKEYLEEQFINFDKEILLPRYGEGISKDKNKEFLAKNNPEGTGAIAFNQKKGATLGADSATFGVKCQAGGSSSFAAGSESIASGTSATALGHGTKASGRNATSLGEGTIAKGLNQLAIGAYNEEISDCAFVIGKGAIDARKNICTIDWNGEAIFSGDVVGQGVSMLKLKDSIAAPLAYQQEKHKVGTWTEKEDSSAIPKLFNIYEQTFIIQINNPTDDINTGADSNNEIKLCEIEEDSLDRIINMEGYIIQVKQEGETQIKESITLPYFESAELFYSLKSKNNNVYLVHGGNHFTGTETLYITVKWLERGMEGPNNGISN